MKADNISNISNVAKNTGGEKDDGKAGEMQMKTAEDQCSKLDMNTAQDDEPTTETTADTEPTTKTVDDADTAQDAQHTLEIVADTEPTTETADNTELAKES